MIEMMDPDMAEMEAVLKRRVLYLEQVRSSSHHLNASLTVSLTGESRDDLSVIQTANGAGNECTV